MTVVKMPATSKIHQRPEKERQQQRRYFTDKSGFCGWVWMVLAYLVMSVMFKLMTRSDLRKEKNKTWESDPIRVNSSSEAISKIFASINNTIHVLNDNNSIKNPYFGNISGLVRTLGWIITIYFIYIRIGIPKMKDICRKSKYSSGLEYTYHFTICNIIRTIPILTCEFTMFNYVLSTDETGQYYEMILLVFPMELMMLYINLMMSIDFFFNSQAKEIGIRVFKFYFYRRNLILFQILNFMAMVLIGAGVIVIMNVYCDNDPVIYVAALMGIFFFVINLMHTYAKMVIMLATANYDWGENKGGISWRSILSSMRIIGRYHIGSLIWYFPFLEFTHYSNFIDPKSYDKREVACETVDKVEGDFETADQERVCEIPDNEDKTYTMPNLMYMMECTEILIAVYGQSIRKAKDTMRQSNIKQKISCDFKSTTLTAWTDIMLFMLPILVYSIAGVSVSSVEKLMSIVLICSSNLLVNGILYYVFIKPINIAELTIQFCINITKEDLEIMELEQYKTNIQRKFRLNASEVWKSRDI